MGFCPKCNNSVDVNDSSCPKCGSSLVDSQESSGTLDANQHFQFIDEGQKSPDPLKEPYSFLSDDQLSDSSGTLGLADLAQAMPISESSTPDSSNEVDSNLAAQVSDSNKTMALPLEADEGMAEENPSSTIKFNNADMRVALGQGESGSEGQLMRVWDAAIGSSGKDSKQSLRFERAEASDSVFRRVATRLISDANSTHTEGVDYQIQDKLGDGGMGVVYSALQTAVNRVVAIKTRKAGSKDDEAGRRQFFYEAEVTAELDHPNIPPIYELGRTEDGTFFYSMKLIRGLEWQKLLRKKTREENLEIFDKIADAVAFAHSKNVIHRDLKPDNVMLGTFGEVYLSDWGLAVNQTKKKDVDFGGTPEFMAPEMARNQRNQIGKHSDIYLLGAILFQVVTGTPPHMGRNQKERLKAAIQNDITPTDKVDPLLDIARCAMETDPSHRYASIADMQAAIREVQTHAESIALANRSDELAETAAQSQDYDKFSRAVFGFRDAIDMWDGNKTAKVGLQKARLAYGQCAFDKGDYDLALQTVDRSIPQEAEVFEKATKAKLAVEQRESRFKTLRRTFVGVVSLLLLVALGAAFVANSQRSIAVIARDDAVKAKTEADKAKDGAVKATAVAVEEKTKAEAAAASEKLAKDDAVEQKDNAKRAEERAVAATVEQEKATNAAVASEKLAKQATDEEKKARKIAQERAVQNRISTSISEMGQAKSSTVLFDNQNASVLLARTKNMDGPEFSQTTVDGKSVSTNIPKFDSFAWQRVNLLTNSDLPKLMNGAKVTAMDFAPAAKIGIFGTENGQVIVLRSNSEAFEGNKTIADFPGSRIDCVAISPSGDQALFSITKGAKSSTYVWSLVGNEQPIEATVLGSKSFEAMRYSPDGKRILVGISGGIRVLTPGEKWTSTDANDIKEIDLNRNILGIRGNLNELQWVDSNTVLASDYYNGQLSLFEINVDKRSSEKITIPEPWSKSLSAAARFGSSERILLASGEGKLSLGKLARSKDKDAMLIIEDVSKLPTEHQAAISRLVVNSDGRILSISDKEPVVHVWKASDLGEVTYDTYLTGVPGNEASTPNIINALFASGDSILGDSILGVDGDGTIVAWNIERQKQRRQLTRNSALGLEENPSPVVGVFGRGDSAQAISVLEDGAIDLWDLQTGKTTQIDAARFSYYGHTPGSVFVDSAADVQSGIIVTSAMLDKAEKRYLKNPNHDWEFCIWEQSTGNMIKRWSMDAPLLDPSKLSKGEESITPRMSMLNSGKEILFASDLQTLVYSVRGEKLDLNKKRNVGTYFAVPNPQDPSLVAMVKRSGLVWLWDRADENSWWTPDPKNPVVPSRENEGVPLKGIWTEDGNRFFLVFSSGYVKSYGKNDFRNPLISIANDKMGKAIDVLKIGDHHDIDLATVHIADSLDRLVLNIRFPGTEPESKMYSLDAQPNRFVASELAKVKGLRWLDTTDAMTPKISNRVHPRFKLNSNGRDSILARQQSGPHTFVSTKSGAIYDLTDESTNQARIGRPKLISSTSDREGSVVMLLHNDGSLLRMDLTAEGTGQWVKVGFSADGFSQIQLSPDKTQLAMLNRDKQVLRILDTVSGVLVREYTDVAVATWDPAEESVLAIIQTDGKVEMIGLGEPIVLRNVDVENGRQVKSVHFFNEAWVDEEATRYLLVQSEIKVGEETSGRIEFVALKPKMGEMVDKGESKALDVKSGLTIATSPVDSIFATGDDAGTVTVWFASPTWDKPGKVFDLEGHRGAAITSIAFGENGQTLVTADKNNRLFGWMSKDSLMKTSK